MFATFLYRDAIQIDDDTVELDEAVSRFHDVEKTDAGYRLTPKAASGASAGNATLASWNGAGGTRTQLAAPGQAQGTTALGPFECKPETPFGEDARLPFELGVAPPVEISIEAEVTREITAAGSKVHLSATPTFKFELSVEATVGFEIKFACKYYIGHRIFPAPLGVVGLIAGGRADYGVGFEIGGEVTVAQLKAGAKLEYAPNIGATMTCPEQGECSFSREDEPSTFEFEPIWELPSLGNAKVEPSLGLFAFVELSGGVTILDSLMYDFLEARAGLELGASLTAEALQIDDTDAEDGRSGYELALKAEVGPAYEFESFLAHFGLDEIVPLKVEVEVPHGKSPTGTLTSERERYRAGERVALKVKLTPSWTVFPQGIGIYNVKRVQIVKRDDVNPLATTVLATRDASAGETEFDFDFVAAEALDASELYAFVLTVLLPLDPPALELAAASVPIRFTFDTNLQGLGALRHRAPE